MRSNGGCERVRNAGLQAALGVHPGRRVRVVDDAAAYAHQDDPAVPEDERSDGDVEAGVARGRDEADGSGVDAAWRVFQIANDAHGADLGRARDGTAGEEAAEEVVPADVVAQFAADGRVICSSVGYRSTVKRRRRGCCPSSRCGRVVAQQVDDHDVLAAVLFVVVEGERGEGVSAESRPRGQVPFMGRVIIWRARTRKKSPGENERIERSPRLSSAEYATGCWRRSAR